MLRALQRASETDRMGFETFFFAAIYCYVFLFHYVKTVVAPGVPAFFWEVFLSIPLPIFCKHEFVYVKC